MKALGRRRPVVGIPSCAQQAVAPDSARRVEVEWTVVICQIVRQGIGCVFKMHS